MSKTKYLCILRSDSGSCEKPPSPAEMEGMYAKFNAWREQFQENIADMGGRLGGGAVLTADGRTDGPFVEGKEIVGGFMILLADSLDEAAEITRACPGVTFSGTTVELREISTP